MQNLVRQLASLEKKNRTAIWLILITIVGGFLRFYNLGGKSLYADEALYWQRAFTQAAGGHFDAVIDIHVYFFLLSQVVKISQSEFALRLLSALPGLLSIPLFYLLLRKFLRSAGALAGTALFAVSPFLIVVAQTVREHTLYLFFIIGLVYFFDNFLVGKRIIDLIAFALISVLAIFTHISAAWMIMAMGLVYLWIIIREPKKINRNQFLGFLAYAIFILSVVIGFWLLGYSARAGWQRESYIEFGYYWDGSIASLFNLAINNTWNMLVGAFNEYTVILALVALAIIFLVRPRPKYKEIKKIYLFALLPILITFITGLTKIYPYIGAHRNNIYLLVGVFLIVALGFDILVQKYKAIFVISIGLMVAFLVRDSWGKVNQPSLQELKPIAETLCQDLEAEDQIFALSTAVYAFDYYWPRCQSPLVHGPEAIPLIYFGFETTGILGEQILPGDHNSWLVLSFLNNNELARVLQNIEGIFGEPATLYQEENGAWLYVLPSIPESNQ
jgi:hypothetical protein